MNEIAAILQELCRPENFPASVATLVHVEGSSYRRPGARLLVTADRRQVGSISGGCLEADLMARMSQLTFVQPHALAVYDTTSENDLLWGVGTGCHGVITLALEYLKSPPDWAVQARARLAARQTVPLGVAWRSGQIVTQLTASATATDGAGDCFHQLLLPPLHLVIFGAGDDARPLVRLAKGLGWDVSVLDPRRDFATPERFPAADRVQVAPAEDTIRGLAWDARCAAVVMTHHYRFDRPLLQQLLPLRLPYLGLLGPRRRAERLLADLGEELDDHPTLFAPVGLDLGGDGAEAVALSALSEIQASFCGRSAQPLRRRTTGIHTEHTCAALGSPQQ